MTITQFAPARGALVASVAVLLVAPSLVAASATAAPSPREQIRAAVAAGTGEHYVRILSANKDQGVSQTMTSLAGPGMGIQVLTEGTSHMTVEYVNHTLYVRASLGFLEGTFGLSSAVATPAVNKWVIVATSNPSYDEVYSAVTIVSAMSFLAGAGSVTEGAPTVVDGIKVKSLRVAVPKSSASPAGIETLYIARTGSPLAVETVFAGVGFTSEETFSQWGKHFSLHVPATSLRMPSAQSA